MFWIIFGMIIMLSLVFYLLLLYFRDRRFEKRSVTETMSDTVWDDIAREREENMIKSRKFKEALSRARQKQNT